MGRSQTIEQVDLPTLGAQIALALHPVRLSTSPTRIILNWRLNVTNTGDSHVVGLRIWSDMTSLRKQGSEKPDADLQESGPVMDRARLHKVPILAPGAEVCASGEWQMPRDHMDENDPETTPFMLPMARFRLVGAGIPPTRLAFVIGVPAQGGEDEPQPLLLDDRMQVFPELTALAHA